MQDAATVQTPCFSLCSGVSLNEYMVVSTAVLGNYFGASAEMMGSEYFCTCTLLRLLFLLLVKNCFSMIASFWARKPHYDFPAGRQIMIIAMLQCIGKLHFSSWLEAIKVNFEF